MVQLPKPAPRQLTQKNMHFHIGPPNGACIKIVRRRETNGRREKCGRFREDPSHKHFSCEKCGEKLYSLDRKLQHQEAKHRNG